jgi:hypothetical protein
MKRWKEWDSERCPRCGSPEDSTHVWLCKGPDTEELWSKAVAELEDTMRKLDTDPTLAHIVSLYLQSWRSGEAITYEPPREFLALLQAQSAVGWGRFFEGWVVLQWKEQQHRYYMAIKSHRTGRRWTIAILQKLWNIAWDMWEHRNGILHEQENLVTRSMIIQLNARVSRVYIDLSSRALRHNDRHLVNLSLSAILKKDTNYKVTWLSIAEPALGMGRVESWRSRTRTDHMVQGMRRCMFSWLRK